MPRKCNCSGRCGPQNDEVSRREFIEIAGAGAAGAVLGGSTPAVGASRPKSPEDLQRWKTALLEPAAARVYESATHGDARMHLGGIGTGNFEIGADGQLTTWQLFNTLRDGHVPFCFLARVGKTAKLLQTRGGPDWPRIKQISMTGEYPLATLRYRDPEFPAQIELNAFSPFAPLDARFSSIPVAIFDFRVHNPTDKPLEISLAALMLNPVGYDASGQIEGHRHPNFGGNVNEVFHDAGATGLILKAETGDDPSINERVTVVTLPNLRRLVNPPHDWPRGLRVEVLDQPPRSEIKLDDRAHTLFWMEDAPADLSPAWLKQARAGVLAGATLVFSGKTMPLLKSYGAVTGGKPLVPAANRDELVFEDFENGYKNWRVEGKAFGAAPAGGTLPGQQHVSGFEGRALVNSFLEGDDTTGRLISKEFTVERNFIRFLVGGGSRPTTQLRLVVEGKTVRATSGRDHERLEPAFWDVSELRGKSAHFEIVDEQKGPWGHINIDRIAFCDQVGDRATLTLLDELLPVRFRDMVSWRPASPDERPVIELQGRADREGTTSDKVGALDIIRRRVGKGQVILALGPVLEVEHAELNAARHRAFADLCGLIGVRYKAPVGVSRKAPGFGSLALAAIAQGATVLPAFEDQDAAWRRFSATGGFTSLDQVQPGRPTPAQQTTSGALATSVMVPAGATVQLPFLLTWHFPNKYNEAGVWMGCHYATVWSDAAAVLREAATNLTFLRDKTERFRKTFYDSTLPYWLLDCLTSQAAIIRHIGVVFRIAGGDIYGWEGSNGCCQPTCTHVWGYEQTLSRLFPDLEREMRRIDFHHQQRPDGGINNRTDVPSPPRPTGEQPFTDGHASCILKAYREALNQPDDSWMKAYWPPVKRAVEYLIARDAAGSAGEPDGILQDDQWNTYDEALHGVTSFLSGYYLAALRAGEAWARRVGDDAAATRFHAIFEKGRENLQKLCWNGEYFEQKLDDYRQREGEVGPGCMSDQLIGQWWAHQLGLGYLLPPERVQSSLRAIFRHNWKPDLTGWKHSPRAFAGAGDKGLIICTWPKGGRPDHVMLYSDEVWTGIEYQVAAHLIYEGMLEEGLAIVKGARDRYDGINRPPIPRNPWNEIECGGHYARAMSSWSLLLALSGYEYDGPARVLRFAPRITPEKFKAFFCGPEGWGSLAQTRDKNGQQSTITVVEGRLPISRIVLNVKEPPKGAKVTLGTAALDATLQVQGDEARIALKKPRVLNMSETLSVVLA
ncbi:MAG: GH116 family glycosyl-hydrolase [Isosphaeraceae bacterium]